MNDNMQDQPIKQEDEHEEAHNTTTQPSSGFFDRQSQQADHYRLNISTEHGLDDEDDDNAMDQSGLDSNDHDHNNNEEDDDDDAMHQSLTTTTAPQPHHSIPTCRALPLGHHILDCGHRAVAPDYFIDAAARTSPCSVNCARPWHPDSGTHTYLCKLCFANQMLRRHMRADAFAALGPVEAVAYVQPLLQDMWAPVDADGSLSIPTAAWFEVAPSGAGAAGASEGLGGAAGDEDQLISEMLAGLQVREQDLDGLLNSMGNMSM